MLSASVSVVPFSPHPEQNNRPLSPSLLSVLRCERRAAVATAENQDVFCERREARS